LNVVVYNSIKLTSKTINSKDLTPISKKVYIYSMKYLCFLIPLLFFCCGGIKQSPIENITTIESKTLCPDDGVCTFDIFKNSTLEIKSDNIGLIYPEINNGNNIVLKFEYTRNEIPNTADSNHQEIIYLELDSNKIENNLKDINLQNVKLLFGRLCFCRGQTGYYKIVNGILSIKKISNNEYLLKLEFKINEVPQVVSIINETFIL